MRILAVALGACVFLFSNVDRSVGQEHAQEERSSQKHAESERRREFSIPVRIVQDPVHQQQTASDAEENKRDNQREDENLAVQRSVAESSEKVAQYAPPMFWLGFGGFVLSLITVAASTAAAWFALSSVREARKATSVAQRSLIVTEDTAKRQLRAYVVLDAADIPETNKGFLYTVVRLKNCGQTPATVTQLGMVCLASGKILRSDLEKLQLKPNVIVLGGGAEIQFHAANTQIEVSGLPELVAKGMIQIGVRVAFKYKDIYGDEHFAEFTRLIEGPRNLHGGLAVSLDYPDITG